MRWRWWRPQPETADPNHGRDRSGRLVDGDTVLPPGWECRSGPVAADRRGAFTEDTAIIPVVTPAARLRGLGGGWR